MTKKILSTLALSLAMLTASAQSQPNRLIVHQKSGSFASYRIGSVDSLSFYNIEGEVRADVKINDYKTGDTGDTLWVAVTKTPACSSYRIDVLPQYAPTHTTTTSSQATSTSRRVRQLSMTTSLTHSSPASPQEWSRARSILSSLSAMTN